MPDFNLLRGPNLNGFAALPDELFLEISNHLPSSPVRISAAPETQIIRRETLHSLAEVCRNLRRVFRPHLWQRVEVYDGIWAGGQRLNHNVSCASGRRPKKHFAKEVLRQLNVVTVQDPDLAQHVRIVDIEVNAATFRPLFTELGRCFSLFPNLHTVKVVTKFLAGYHEDGRALAAAKRCFKMSVPYPQIRSVILSPSVYPLLAVCPNLESLTSFDEYPTLLAFIKGPMALQKLSCPLSLLIPTGHPPYNHISKQYTTQIMEVIQLFPKVRTLILHRGRYSSWMSTEILKQGFLDLPRSVCPNLKEVIFSGYPLNPVGIEEEILVVPEF